jgi:hypothetical protein
MNERIQEFILQATETTDVYNPDTGITHYRDFFDHEKFAELIVKECASELIRWKDEPFPYDPEFGASLIKQHFGIK